MLRYVALFLLLGVALPAAQAAEAPRPNILWLSSEDHGPQMGCYGDKFATTPNVDTLAAQGMIYLHAWSCAPVCAPARTTIISGMYPPSLGAEHMRSQAPYPKDKVMFPQLLRKDGYYCTNNAKEDYNLEKPGQVWDVSSKKGHWRNRPQGAPFFAVFNSEKSHESQVRKRPHTAMHDASQVRVPAYHPDTPEVRRDWAQYYDQVSAADADAGARLAELTADGLADDTIVFYFADHGPGMPRSKRSPCNSGLQMPLVVYIPEKFKSLAPPEYKAGGKSERLVSFVDFAPTVLSLAGIKAPEYMQGHAFLGKYQAPPQPYVYGFRGRMDERYDLIRSVTDGRYVYVRNFLPHYAQGEFLEYMFQTPTTKVWHELFVAGKLTPEQRHFWEPKPTEELYDLTTDRDEVHNLADSAEHKATLEKMRAALREHSLRTRDTGFLTETEMHLRAGKGSIYDVVQDPAKYPLERILDMAELASSRQADAKPKLLAGLKDADAGVRYWAAMGFVILGQSDPALKVALADTSPSVRIAAAQALAQAGTNDDRAAALDVLKELASPAKNGEFTALLALHAIDKLGAKAASLREFVKTLPATDPKAGPRGTGYAARLLTHMRGAQ